MVDVLEIADRLWRGEASIDEHHPFAPRGGLTEVMPGCAFVPSFANVSALATDDGLVLVLDQASCATIRSVPRPLDRPVQALLVCQTLDALTAIQRIRPDLVFASWLPPGRLLDQLIRAPVRYVLEIGAKDGVMPGAWSWRFAHEFCEEIERSARCRLDERPRRTLHSRVTLYYGARHPEHDCEQVRPGDWLWQFRPRARWRRQGRRRFP